MAEQFTDQPVTDEEKEVKKTAKGRYLVFKASNLRKVAQDSRRRYDWEWLTRDLYRRGYHFSSYNASKRSVILSTRSQAKVVINLVWAQMRVIRNQVTSFRPKWEVLPVSKSDEATANARYSGKLLDYYFDRLKLRKMIKETVIQALMYSVGGPWQVGYDPEGDNGNGEVFIWLVDTYDFYVDPNATCVEDAEFVCKSVRRPLEEIKSNPNYTFPTPLEHGERKLASSEYKQFLLQALKVQSQGDEAETDGAILNEMWMKVRVTEKNKEELIAELKENEEDTDKLRIGEVLMRVITYVDLLQDPLRLQLLRRNDYPFVIYQGDINPLELYGEGWIKHLIPMNRVLDSLETSVFNYNYKYAKGRLAVPKNSGVRMISNEHGDIVEYNAGATPPTSIPLAPLQQSYQMQIDHMIRYIEDVGGAHDISLGRIPAGVTSGVGIAELKSADSTNQQDLVDNLEEFLVEVAKKLLREISQNYDVPRLIKALGKGGDPNHFAVIGERGTKSRKNTKEVKIGADVFDLAVIGNDNEVRVSIGSWLAHTKSAQQDKLMEYFQAGLIDQKTFLENAEFADINNIVDRTREEETLKKFRGTPAQPGMPSDEEIAQQENIQIIQEGKMIDALPEDNHQVHLIIHQDALGANGNPILEGHMAQHEKFIQEGTIKQVQTLTPTPQMQQQPQGSPEEQALMQSMQEAGGMGVPQQAPQQPPQQPVGPPMI